MPRLTLLLTALLLAGCAAPKPAPRPRAHPSWRPNDAAWISVESRANAIRYVSRWRAQPQYVEHCPELLAFARKEKAGRRASASRHASKDLLILADWFDKSMEQCLTCEAEAEVEAACDRASDNRLRVREWMKKAGSSPTGDATAALADLARRFDAIQAAEAERRGRDEGDDTRVEDYRTIELAISKVKKIIGKVNPEQFGQYDFARKMMMACLLVQGPFCEIAREEFEPR